MKRNIQLPITTAIAHEKAETIAFAAMSIKTEFGACEKRFSELTPNDFETIAREITEIPDPQDRVTEILHFLRMWLDLLGVAQEVAGHLLWCESEIEKCRIELLEIEEIESARRGESLDRTRSLN